MSKYELIFANCLDSHKVKESSVDLTITSPPYNLNIPYGACEDNLTYKNYLEFTKKWLSNVFLWTKSTGRLCLNIPLTQNKYGQESVGSDITQIAKDIGWKYHTTIIWNGGNIGTRTAWGSFKSASAPYVIAPVELILVLYKDNWKRENQGVNDITKKEFISWTNGLWSFNGESRKKNGHPAPFPKELPRRCIKLFSFIGDTVLDPFAGSGTTLIESINSGRYGIAIDNFEDYHDIIKKRIFNETFIT